MKNLKYIFILFLIIIHFQTNAQTTYEEFKAALIIQFVKNITWPNENSYGQFNIGFYGNDSSTYEVVVRGMKGKKVKGKEIVSKQIQSLERLDGLQVLYVDNINSDNLHEVVKKIENEQILLITDQSKDLKNVMLNIVYLEKEGLASFEINKTNILLEGLIIEPELLLLRGTEVDVRQLFNEIKKELEIKNNENEEQKFALSITSK